MKRFLYSISAAIGLHLLALLTLSWKFTAPNVVREIPIDFFEKQESKLAFTASPYKVAAPPIALSALAPSWKWQSASMNSAGATDSAAAPSLPSSESIVKADHLGAMQWVYRKTKLSLGYPAEFLKNDIEGNVEAELAFDVSGKFIPKALHVHSDSPYLRVYVYRLLERVFAEEPIPEKLRKWQTTLNVICYFEFAKMESEMAIDMHLTAPVLGNQLFFHERKVKPKLGWKIGPLAGYGPVPLGLDMLWFAKKAKDIVDGKPPVDELAPYREDPLFQSDG